MKIESRPKNVSSSGAANGASPSPTGAVSIYNNSAQITTTVLGIIEAGGVANLTVENNVLIGGCILPFKNKIDLFTQSS